MISLKHFLTDDKARIPFSVIGIFLLLGSSFTTFYVIKLEQEKSFEIASTIDFNEVENLIRFAEADINTAINLAGMKALKVLGETPVVNAYADAGFGSTADEVNNNRIKKMIMDYLNIYLTSTYQYDVFNDGRYAINVVIPVGEEYPIVSIDDVTLNSLEMDIVRSFAIPFIGPSEKLKNQPGYYLVNIPIGFEVKRLHDGEIVGFRTINASSIVTSRYLLLKTLVDDYHDTLDGVFKPLWSLTTALSNVYSLIRGYKHYSSGQPLNVVDNKHLALIVNGGILLEQGLVFSSVDPLSVVEFAKKTWETLKKTSGDQTLADIFNDMEEDGFRFDPNEFSSGTANIDAGDDVNNSINNFLDVNVSDIAERILYNVDSVTLVFKNPGTGLVVTRDVVFDDDFEDVIKNIVDEMVKQGFVCNETIKHLVVNQSTAHKINDVVSEVYTAGMHTDVKRVFDVVLGQHVGYPDDEGFGSWELSFGPVLLNLLSKPDKGFVNVGCTLYGEVYDVRWVRWHMWSETHEETDGNSTWNVTTYFTTEDYKNETVTVRVLLDSYSKVADEKTWVGVKDVFYYNNSVDDPNLEDTVDAYVDMYLNPNREDLVLHGNGLYYGSVVDGVAGSWVDGVAWTTMNDVLAMVRGIRLDESITSTNYPDPYDFIAKVREDLLKKFDANISLYLNKSSYMNGGVYSCVGNKAVYLLREWYVYKTRYEIEHVLSSVTDSFDKKLGEALDDYALGLNTNDIRQALSDTKDALKNGFTIPFGFDMDVVRTREGKTVWNETLRCAVDQYPDYLDPFEKTSYGDEEIWVLKLRNRCTLGPTGLPILPPTPVTPWVVTLNIWVIDVEGEYAQFKVIDSNDETFFNPILGHEPQVYIRESRVISIDGVQVGENTRLSFGFTTVSFGVVPPWGMMLGDLEGDCWDEHTPGYD
ncbi:MAG: hypothetical protein QHH19_01580 [Candidatus Thermoplasmatota archaeon]|jgi:hypothetical protein|nr:hypothetical protein [Candidatus Thermoplasmatota archaeon]